MFPIYCINLDHRTDRKRHSLKEFAKLNIPHSTVIYPRFTKDRRGGVYGCFNSHMRVWKKSLQHTDVVYTLVVEDDFCLSDTLN